MAIESKTLPYPDFVVNEILDPQEFDDNNATLVNAVNEIIALLNVLTDSVTDGASGADSIAITPVDSFSSVTIQSLIEEINAKLKAVTDGASGADYIGASAIDGVTGATVQSQLESLKSLVDTINAIILVIKGTGWTDEDIKTNASNHASHIANTSNPHEVTVDQLNVYTKTNMQTSGQAELHWENLTNKPNFADASWKASVATPANLPITGNTIGDQRTVIDDGDGKLAFYSCVAITGDVDAQWDKTGDVDWQSGETDRLAAELLRVSAEEARVTAEELRVTAEGLRVTAEEARATAEEERVTAEDSRVSVEEARVTSEGLRVTAEEGRVTAEGLRVTAEGLRVTAEESRVTAEESRVTAESARETAIGNLVALGEYAAETTYEINNTILYLGSSYRCILQSTGNLPTDETYWVLEAQKGVDGEGAGDMLAETYDPNAVGGDAFAMDNMVESATAKVFTATERSAIVTNSNKISYPTTDSNKLATIEESADVTDAVNVASAIHGVATATPENADEVALIDTGSSNALKKVTWTNIKAFLKTYFDGLYNNYTHPASHEPSIITQDVNNRFVSDTEKSTWNGKISGSGVTYENLNTNGDVGTGSTQVAKGDHTHDSRYYTETEMDTKLGDKADKDLTINAKTAAYSLVAGDAGEVLDFTSSTGYTLTIPKNTTTSLDVGFTVTIIKSGTGDVTIDPATDVTLNGGTDSLTLSDQYGAVTLIKKATDTWYAVGAI